MMRQGNWQTCQAADCGTQDSISKRDFRSRKIGATGIGRDVQFRHATGQAEKLRAHRPVADKRPLGKFLEEWNSWGG